MLKTHSWSQFLTDFHIWPTKSKLRTSSTRKKIVWWCLYAHKGPKNGNKCWCWQFLAHFLPFFRPLKGNKTSPNYFLLVEEVLSFDLVGHMWKSVKNWLQKCILYLGEFFCIFWNCLLAMSLSNVKNVTSQHVDVTYTTQYLICIHWFPDWNQWPVADRVPPQISRQCISTCKWNFIKSIMIHLRFLLKTRALIDF